MAWSTIASLLAGGVLTVYYPFFGTSSLALHAGFRGLCVTTVFVDASLLTEVDDARCPRVHRGDSAGARRGEPEPGRSDRETAVEAPADD